jgi:hypothetical protein
MFGMTKSDDLAHTAPMLLDDDALSEVAGARHGRRRRRHGHGHCHDHGGGGGGGGDLEALLSSLGNFQTNVSGPIIQIAIGNLGDVTQIASVSQSNSASF